MRKGSFQTDSQRYKQVVLGASYKKTSIYLSSLSRSIALLEYVPLLFKWVKITPLPIL